MLSQYQFVVLKLKRTELRTVLLHIITSVLKRIYNLSFFFLFFFLEVKSHKSAKFMQTVVSGPSISIWTVSPEHFQRQQ